MITAPNQFKKYFPASEGYTYENVYDEQFGYCVIAIDPEGNKQNAIYYVVDGGCGLQDNEGGE